MPTFGDRLREVREHLKISQQEMANRCGISLRSQRNYEKGERSPDSEYMAALSGQGIDVTYLLTGNKTLASAIGADIRKAKKNIQQFERDLLGIEVPESAYTSRKIELTKNFDLLDESGKVAIEAMLSALLTKHIEE